MVLEWNAFKSEHGWRQGSRVGCAGTSTRAMHAKTAGFLRAPRASVTTPLAAAACVATLDMAFAIGFWGVHGVSPVRVLQSVASGLLGRGAFAGGASTAALGLGLHFTIAFLMVCTYAAMASRLPRLHDHAWLAGPTYGLALYAWMTWIVLPLSAAPARNARPDWIVGSVLSHAFLVGLPCALFMRGAHTRRTG